MASLTDYIGTSCEVKTRDNELICVGKLYKTDGDQLEIAAPRGERLPIVFCNTRVKVNFNGGPGFYSVGGDVFISNEKFWRIINIQEYQKTEQRSYFRVRADANAEAAVVRSHLPEGEEPVLYRAKVIDVSLTGVQLACNEKFEQGEKLRLVDVRITEEMPAFEFKCHVCWVKEAGPLAYRYGCSFDKLQEKEMDLLCKALFILQREAIRRMKSRF